MVAWYPPSGLGGNDLIQTSTWLVGAAPVIGMVVVRSATRTVASSRVLSSPPGVADADERTDTSNPGVLVRIVTACGLFSANISPIPVLSPPKAGLPW